MDYSLVITSTTIWTAKTRTTFGRILAVGIALCLSLVPYHQICAQELAEPTVLDTPIAPDAGGVPIGSSIGPDVMHTNFVGCASCGSIGCSGCEEFGPGYQCPPGIGLWIRADYLIWYEKESDIIPLVSSSSLAAGAAFDPATLPDDFMTLGAADTTIVFGDESYDDNPVEGWRIEVGAWLDAAATYGIMGRYLDVGGRNANFSGGSRDFNFLGIPYIDDSLAAGDNENNENIVILNGRDGQIDIDLSGSLKSWEILMRRFAQSGSNYRIDWLYGYRNFSLDESLRMESSTIVTAASEGIVDEIKQITDQFDVENRFHGIDLGITGHSHEGSWSLDFLAKVAIGAMEHEVDVSGERIGVIPEQTVTDNNGVTTVTPQLGPVKNVGGLFSQESNIGKNDETDFAVIPEFDVNVGYGLTPNLDITVGYTFIYVSSVVHAGTAVDRTVHSGFIGDVVPFDSNRPQVIFDDEGYFIHGLNLGVTGRF